MDEQELVRIDLRLPASALDSLSRLAEQLRLLTDAVNSRPERSARQAVEYGENTFFDASRFQHLQPEAQSASPKGQSADPAPDPGPAVPVRASVTEEVRVPESAGREAAGYQEEPAQAGSPGRDGGPGAGSAVPDAQSAYTAQTVQEGPAGYPDGIPAVRPEMRPDAPEPPTAKPAAERQLPEGNGARAHLPTWDALPTPVREDVQPGVASPLGAGTVITAGPDIPQSRWTGITEELVVSGPAPLTAESVSLAFQRDGRRYDNGFPLY